MQQIIGSIINKRYKVESLIGRGGMAEVYIARDMRLDTKVAVKLIRLDRFQPEIIQGVMKRFENEAKKMAQLSHPNIVKVTDYGRHAGIPYLVMEYMPNGTLKRYLGKPMPFNQAAKLIQPLAEALAYTHAKGIIHRDVKPSNVLISETGTLMLSDFGVAKIIDDEQTRGLTVTGASIGTPEYMAPEQAVGKKIDQRVDIYSLGVILYELVTGRRPYTAETPMELIVKQSRDPLPPPSQVVKNLSSNAEKVIENALEKEPEKRYKNMNAFIAALNSITANKEVIRNDQKKSQNDQMIKRKKNLLLVWIGAGLVVVAGVVGLLTLFKPGIGDSIKANSTNQVIKTAKEAVDTKPINSPGKPINISVISYGAAEEGQSYQAIKDGADQAGSDLGAFITFTGPKLEDNDDAIADQVELLESAIANGADAICLYAIHPESLSPTLEKAKNKGIPVIGLGKTLDGAYSDTTVLSTGSALGAEAADKIFELIGGKGLVAIIGGNDTEWSNERIAGFNKQLINYPEVRVLVQDYTDFDELNAIDITSNILTIDPELEAIFCPEQMSVKGIVTGIIVKDAEGVKLVSIDTTTEMTKYIRSGIYSGAIVQDSFNMGYQCVEAAIKVYNGEFLPNFIDSGSQWVDAGNIDNPEIFQLLID